MWKYLYLHPIRTPQKLSTDVDICEYKADIHWFCRALVIIAVVTFSLDANVVTVKESNGLCQCSDCRKGFSFRQLSLSTEISKNDVCKCVCSFKHPAAVHHMDAMIKITQYGQPLWHKHHQGTHIFVLKQWKGISFPKADGCHHNQMGANTHPTVLGLWKEILHSRSQVQLLLGTPLPHLMEKNTAFGRK